MHAGDEIPEECQHLDGGEAKQDGKLLLEEPHDLECLKELDYSEWLKGS